MIFDNKTLELSLVLNDRIATNELDVCVEYSLADDNGNVIKIGQPKFYKTTSTTPINLCDDIVDSKYIINSIVITNLDTVESTIILNATSIKINYSNEIFVIRKITLQPDESVIINSDLQSVVYSNLPAPVLPTQTNLALPVSSTDFTPNSGYGVFYPFNYYGKTVYKTGADQILQEVTWFNQPVEFKPQSSSGIWIGTTGTNLGTVSGLSPSITNIFTHRRRTSYASAAVANQQVGTFSSNQFIRGNDTTKGGFFCVCEIGATTWTAGNRLFVGFSSGTSSLITATNPSANTNIFGIGVDSGDLDVTIMTNDSIGTATKISIPSVPRIQTGQGYRIIFFAPRNQNYITIVIFDLNTGLFVYMLKVESDLPVNNTYLCFNAAMGNVANSGSTGLATLSVCNAMIQELPTM